MFLSANGRHLAEFKIYIVFFNAIILYFLV
nr:MAG TPA: hypothetical protein [Caudoviricetes sp.]